MEFRLYASVTRYSRNDDDDDDDVASSDISLSICSTLKAVRRMFADVVLLSVQLAVSGCGGGGGGVKD